ncbi:hypothetical protein [Oceanirhabdus seepicola]|uniref:Lipoprotein n=1 Tax=Oceanirhabdus seepicola TaxID=2828781 RepID=A0A9J6P381_9CLOT|nr:hypothetical protein [Oceanirhabdus seepicola]MCM1991003.1 hypothetical protein [Oceanirhabdus seepicola]
MNQRKVIKLISIVLLAMFTFVSCSKGAKEISQALLKTAKIKSYTFDSSAKMHLEFPGELIGLEGSFPLDLKLSSTGAYKQNADKLPTALVNMNLDVMDLNFDTEYYIEPSKDGEKNLQYYMKMPKFMKSALGFGTKKEEYLEFNLNELLSIISYAPIDNELYEQILTSQETAIEMNKDVLDILQSLGTDKSLKNIITDKGYQTLKRRKGTIKAKTYELNINNENFKLLLKSIVSNDEAIKKLLELTKKYSAEIGEIDVDSILSELNTNREMLLSQIDVLPDILGEKGLTCTFSIKNGNIIYQKYALDINVENMVKLQAEIETSYYDINDPIKIARPKIANNSINAIELLNKLDPFYGKIEEETVKIESKNSSFLRELILLQDTGSSIEGTVSDYFYPQEKAIYHFTDEAGIEVYSIGLEYFTDEKIQAKYSSPYGDYSIVYSLKDNIARTVYLSEYTESTELISEENMLGSTMISGPLKEGNFWTNIDNIDNTITYISSVSTEVTTPSGTYNAIELINFVDDNNYIINYYAKGVGLVKTITNLNSDYESVNTTLELSKIEK